MKLQNSYIFLNNPSRKEQIKKPQVTDEVIVLDIGKNVYSFIATAFPNLSEVKTDDNFFKSQYQCSFSYNAILCKVVFIINEVADITYLDVIVEGKTKSTIICCLEQIQNTLLTSGIRDEYIDIVSYDSISEYYCNKILPKLNALERNLRKLLLNIYIVKFGKEYYSATVSQELQNKIKGVIRAKGSEEEKKIERLQNFFYSFEFSDIQKLLFQPNWTNIDEQAKEDFLDSTPNLSQLSDEQLRNAFSQLAPKSDWERLFSSKFDFPNIQEIIEKIRQHRNTIAHFKFFYKGAYLESNQLITRLNAAVINAIKLTEDEDFIEKNTEFLRNALVRLSKTFERIEQTIAGTISKNLLPTLQLSSPTTLTALEKLKHATTPHSLNVGSIPWECKFPQFGELVEMPDWVDQNNHDGSEK